MPVGPQYQSRCPYLQTIWAGFTQPQWRLRVLLTGRYSCGVRATRVRRSCNDNVHLLMAADRFLGGVGMRLLGRLLGSFRSGRPMRANRAQVAEKDNAPVRFSIAEIGEDIWACYFARSCFVANKAEDSCAGTSWLISFHRQGETARKHPGTRYPLRSDRQQHIARRYCADPGKDDRPPASTVPEAAASRPPLRRATAFVTDHHRSIQEARAIP